jgi:uncharacterized membrane protein
MKRKTSFVKIASGVWIIGLIMSGFLLSVPPDDVPVFIGLACIGSIPLIFGSRRYQIFGITAVAGSLMLAYWDYQTGLRIRARHERLTSRAVQNDKPTNNFSIQSTNR